MNWIITDLNNIIIILCGVFYSILCIFSIVTGIIYIRGKRKLNPLELPDSFMDKLKEKDELKRFAIKMGYVTFIVGIVQGVTAFSIFKGHSIILYFIVIGFTIFSICSVLFKLKGKINAFPIIKLIFYLIVLILMLLPNTRLFFLSKRGRVE